MLHFRDINLDTQEDIACLVRWGNDPSIRHLFQRFTSQKQSERKLTIELLFSHTQKALARGKIIRMIEWEDRIIGEVSLEMNTKQLYSPKPDTAWLGIVIGEEQARGRGFGQMAMQHIEEIAKHKGAQYLQLGVFAFNTAALSLYRRMQYQEVTTTPNYTWHAGARYADIRFEKSV